MTSAVPSLSSHSAPRTSATTSLRRFRPHQYLAHANSRPDHLYILRRGWAVRYRQMRDGRRQITGFYLPGDPCDIHWLDLAGARQAVQATTDIEAIEVPCATVELLAGEHRAHFSALCNEMALQSAVQAEQCLTIGRKSAAERLAQLFCEIIVRLDPAHAVDGQIAMPLTQQDLADILGLTPIHINRVLRELRDDGLVVVKARRLIVPDLARLQSLAQFDPRYLEGLQSRRLRHLFGI